MFTVDTQVIIWNALKPETLSSRAKKAIEKANKTNGMLISDISLWEIAMLIKKERLKIDLPFVEFIKLIKIVNK